MQEGEIFEYKGKTYKVKNEESEYSCEGCSLHHILCDNAGKPKRDKFGEIIKRGCDAKSEDKIFDNCKRDHVIFVRI